MSASVLASAGSTRPNPEAHAWPAYATLVGQLLVLVFAIYFMRLENEAFARLMALTTLGFAIHYVLPFRHRLRFFVGLSFAGLVLVLGPLNASWVIGLGAAILGIAHLPVTVYSRVALLLGVGGLLAVPRWGLGEVPWSPAIWPILGSLFVFRLLSYMYEISHGMKPASISQVLAYFFLLPNVCFPLFPIIDFKRFVRGYYDAERHGIYQVGIEWIWRGLLQLVIYRVVYFHLTIDPVDTENVIDLAIYMLSTYMLYVRLSGYFHIVVGMLHLFGFNLPETHHRYFLATSFTDYWRRINIYWKDFMLKIFYYPVYFALRKLGDTKALVVATVATFFATWCLHMAQWFWIRGSVLVEWNDIVFWSLLGMLVLFNSLSETRHGRTRATSPRSRTWGEGARIVAKTVGTFVAICLLWSFWSAESATDWGLMVSNAMSLPAWPAWQWIALFGTIGGSLVLWSIGVWKGWGSSHPPLVPTVTPARIVVTTVLLCGITAPGVTARLGPGGETLDSLRLASTSALNRRDAEQFQRGYYENLVDVSKFNSELWNRYQQLPQDFVRSLDRLGLSRDTNDEQDYVLAPLQEGRFVGAWVRTNRWGMRDRDYPQQPPPGSTRVALLGPSTAMGSGVEEDESLEAVLEQRLATGVRGSSTYEVLNFGVAGYSPLHSLFQLDRKVFAFQPDVIMYLGHAGNAESAATHLTRMVRRGVVPAGSYLADIVRASGLTVDTRPTEARRRLKPFTRPLLEWVYREMVSLSEARGAIPVFVYMELVTEPGEAWRATDRETVLETARRSGFRFVDLTGAYGSREPETLWIAPGDGHPNAVGNRLLADLLYSKLRANPGLLGLPDQTLGTSQ